MTIKIKKISKKIMGLNSAGRLIQMDLVTLIFNLNHWFPQNESKLGIVLYLSPYIKL